ncbi:MAG: hypothetical protein CMB56_000315 [Methanobacteriota archaeon]|nr:MAG: hypothetical protein CMB56_000315 [Euryarchaeota archaeon]|tara:strand:- start:949 stop:1743 length:795 start_codon:yes stop_codon:yes gene_type:complete
MVTNLESNIDELLSSPGGKLLNELSSLMKKRARIFAIIFTSIFAIGYPLAAEFISWLVSEETGLKPSSYVDVITLHPVELVLLKVRISLFLSIMVTGILFVVEMARLLSKSETFHERLIEADLKFPNPNILALFLIFSSILLMISGSLYAIKYLIPFLLDYLAKDALSAGLSTEWTLTNFSGFISSLLFASALGFQVPVIVYLILKFEIVQRSEFTRYRKHIWFSSVVLGAFLSPPDPLSLVLVAAPMIILFEISLFFHKVFHQ